MLGHRYGEQHEEDAEKPVTKPMDQVLVAGEGGIVETVCQLIEEKEKRDQ